MKKLTCFIAVIIFTISGTVTAQNSDTSYRGWGPRVGITSDPDQIHFGVHFDMGNLSNRLRFQPNFELGIGDNFTIAAVNAEVNYRFRSKWDVWTPYLGGGVGLLFIDHDNNGIGGGSDTEFGASIVGGIEKGISGGDRFFIETKLGLVDAPDLKITVGWTFGH